jgi:RNA recognition motif-containing protein
MRPQAEKLATKFLEAIKKSPVPQKPSIETSSAPVSKDEALKMLPAETTQSSVFVTNISKQTTVDILVDFFSYCGPVTNTQLYK